MDNSKVTLTPSRLLMLVVFTLVSAWLIFNTAQRQENLSNPNTFTGWILFGALVLLFSFYLRKRLSNLPLGRAAFWTRLHILLGAIALVLFFLHSGFALPQATLNILLWLNFLLISISGIFGVLLIKTSPKKLNLANQIMSSERLKFEISQREQRAEQRTLDALKTSGSKTIDQLYRKQIAPFFRYKANRLLVNKDKLLGLNKEINAAKRYLNQQEADALQAIQQLAEEKQNLAEQLSQHRRLQFWLFIHVPLCFSLIVLICVHGILVHAFSMGGI